MCCGLVECNSLNTLGILVLHGGTMDNHRNGPRRDGGGFRGGGGRGGRRFGGPREPREMHKAVCDECKKECEVPFKPTEGKPVYCKECYKKKKGF
jgi:CxxC-x17-CxxC domain-containing protein